MTKNHWIDFKNCMKMYVYFTKILKEKIINHEWNIGCSQMFTKAKSIFVLTTRVWAKKWAFNTSSLIYWYFCQPRLTVQCRCMYASLPRWMQVIWIKMPCSRACSLSLINFCYIEPHIIDYEDTCIFTHVLP